MQHHTCKCGKRESWNSGFGPFLCQGCDICGTSMGTYKGEHKPTEPHELITEYDQKTGKPYQRCKVCYEKIKEEGQVK